ncbi:MAG TPA: ubiquinol-cytochrome c reductase iron-sulfur subunit [Trichocoleus sp.]
MDRRIFLQWVGLGWLASVLPGCFSQSSGGGGVAGTAQSPSAASVSMGPVSTLEQAGFVLNQDTPLGPVLVTQEGAGPNALKAVNPTCTHKGCVVEWKSEQKELVCPCHAARFAADGAVLGGPATEPLAVYEARVENDNILVSQSNG